MDDGLGFSIGAFFGGFLFQNIGGQKSFRVFASIALLTCIAHIFLRPASTHEIRKTNDSKEKVQDVRKDETAMEEKKLTEA